MPAEYAKVTGRFAVIVGDSDDVGDEPDKVYCSAGTVTFTPTVSEVRLDGEIVATAPVVCTIDAEGYLSSAGQQYVQLLDLGSESVNPRVAADRSTYTVKITGIEYADPHNGGQPTPVPFGTLFANGVGIHPTPAGQPATPGENPLALLLPLAVTGGQAIVQGPKGDPGDGLVIDGITDGQQPAWDATTGEWVAVDPGTGGGEPLTDYTTQVETLPDYPTSFPTTWGDIAQKPASIAAGADPATARAAIAAGQIDALVGGTNVTIDATDPANPVINVTATVEGTVDWTTGITGKPPVIAEGATQQDARDAIGAGTSNLTLGSTNSTAKAGDYKPTWAEVTGKPAVIAGGSTAAEARAAVGAGTSNFSGSFGDLSGMPNYLAYGNTAALAREAIGAGTSDYDLETLIPFSTLSGATDDDKLAAGVAMVQSATLKGRGVVLDESRDYTFTRTVTIPSGFAIIGTFRGQDQPRSSRPIGNRVLLRMTGSSAGRGWLKIGSGNTFGVYVAGLSIEADINSTLFDGSEDNGGVLWTSQFHNISIQNAKSVFGSKSNRLAITDVVCSGFWNINNVRETAWNIGGSDSRWVPDLMLIDSPSELLGFNEYLMTSHYLANYRCTNVYVTAEAHSAIYIGGSDNGSQSVVYRDWECEGRNEDHPSPGALVRVEAGQGQFKDCRFAFGMANPDLVTNRTDQGVIHVEGGDWTFDGCTYERGNTVTSWAPPASPALGDPVAEDVPFIYVGAGAKRVRVRNIIGNGPFTGDRSWVGKPVVKQALPGLVDADDSVTVVTSAIADVPNAAGDTTTGHANSGTSVTVDAPANVADGDLLVAAVYSRGASSPYSTPPAGWAAMDPTTDDTGAGVIRLYWKIAASEPGSYTWSGGGSGRHAAIVTRVTGATSTPVDVIGNPETLTTFEAEDRIVIPSVTTTTDLDLLIMVGTSNATGGVAPAYTGPAGTSVVASTQTSTGGSESGLTMVVEQALPVGTTGSRKLVAASSASSGVGYMVALKSAG